MEEAQLALLIRVAGVLQLGVLLASAVVPFRLDWQRDLASLPRLHRQMYWTYGGYVVLGIVFLGLAGVLHAERLADGSALSRFVCGFGVVFWGVRLGLQGVFDVKLYLTAWWLRAGYHGLTVVFVVSVVAWGLGVLGPGG